MSAGSQDNIMIALTSLSREESELITQIQQLSERLDTVQKVVKTLSRIVHPDRATMERLAADVHP